MCRERSGRDVRREVGARPVGFPTSLATNNNVRSSEEAAAVSHQLQPSLSCSHDKLEEKRVECGGRMKVRARRKRSDKTLAEERESNWAPRETDSHQATDTPAFRRSTRHQGPQLAQFVPWQPIIQCDITFSASTPRLSLKAPWTVAQAASNALNSLRLSPRHWRWQALGLGAWYRFKIFSHRPLVTSIKVPCLWPPLT